MPRFPQEGPGAPQASTSSSASTRSRRDALSTMPSSSSRPRPAPTVTLLLDPRRFEPLWPLELSHALPGELPRPFPFLAPRIPAVCRLYGPWPPWPKPEPAMSLPVHGHAPTTPLRSLTCVRAHPRACCWLALLLRLAAGARVVGLAVTASGPWPRSVRVRCSVRALTVCVCQVCAPGMQAATGLLLSPCASDRWWPRCRRLAPTATTDRA